MLDFMRVATRSNKKNVVEIYPKFIIGRRSTDLMIRGGDFYAIWIEERKMWSTDETDAIQLIDRELDQFCEEHKGIFEGTVKVLHMWDAETGMIDVWHKYCQKQLRDSFHMLDEKLIFSNVETQKKDYASKKLPYPLERGETPAWDKLVGTLYSPEERHKIEWAIGAIVSGDSRHIQKFMVFYGAAGTGKSTILNVIQKLFEGYYSVFDAKALGSSSNSFALEAFKSNPLVAIQHDGDLSRIEDNTRLNSLVSHELMTVNEKFKSAYSNRFKAFLFMGTNKPVRITDGRSGLLRRLIDVSPSGNKLSTREYRLAVKQVDFELGAIAQRCLDVYEEDPTAYDDYVPVSMMSASNDFYNYILDAYYVFKQEDSTTLKTAWERYRVFCDEAKVAYPMSQRVFKEELKNYFWEYEERHTTGDGKRVRSYYNGFRLDKVDFDQEADDIPKPQPPKNWIELEEGIESIFDKECYNCPAQYGSRKETPLKPWAEVKSTLSELDTGKLHYVRVPLNHIVIDFDLKDSSGKKSLELNLAEASKWPKTYCEVSKGGRGLHLHYIYSGDPEKLSRVFDDHVEIKVFTGNSALRRKLSLCNRLAIATISSGLPMKGEKMVNSDVIKSERTLRTMIKKNLNKEYHPNTKPSIDFIHKILEDTYKSGLIYDVSDMRSDILTFAGDSTNQADYCVRKVGTMRFKSEERSEGVPSVCDKMVFYDIEIFPNLFLVNWKLQGEDKKVVRMINPKPEDIRELVKYRLVGFNCRRYDNHLLYAAMMGYTNEELYERSQRIINKENGAFIGEAYNLSYTDVYDFCSTKQSLKKWEIELGIHHQELGLPWDQPVPEELWPKVAEYCDNDVLATEAVFNARQGDFIAREILADVAGMTVNDTTNTLTTRIIFGKDRHPQSQFRYRDMGDTSVHHQGWTITDDMQLYTSSDEFTVFDDDDRPIFPGYKHDAGKSTYRGFEVGEGGFVYSEPGMYGRTVTFDVASMHPSSVIAEELFGPVYTKRFKDILDARIAIKHKDFESAKKMLDGKLAKYLTDESKAKALAQALKIAINSVYGLTAANFDNAFRDPRNKDNIVAKRGALFMINLLRRVQELGGTVIHVKTDSIKVLDPSKELSDFIMNYGKMYGYNFEVEHIFEKICLVNDAVYIAKLAPDDPEEPGQWTATGTQFAVPYVFKTLFTHEDILFEDMCETKAVSTALYLKDNDPDSEKKLIDLNTGREVTIKRSDTPEFVGRVGQFCPIKPGCGGKELLRESKDKDGNVKYGAATGAKGYYWLESEVVKQLHKEKDIDRSYYNKLVDAAVDTISKYGDFEQFVSDGVEWPPVDEPPWDEEKIFKKENKIA